MGPSTGFIHFWSSCRPRKLHTGAYPPSPRSSDLSQASLSFDLVVDPYELSYWGISPPEFTCIIIWVILWFWVTWSGHSSSCHVSLSRGRTYIDRPSSCQFSFWDRTYTIGHYRVSLSQGRTHIDRPFPYQFVFSLSRDRTHIDRSFILPIRSVRRPGLCFSMTFRVTFPFWAFRVILFTWLLDAYRLFIIALLDFPFHYTWHIISILFLRIISVLPFFK